MVSTTAQVVPHSNYSEPIKLQQLSNIQDYNVICLFVSPQLIRCIYFQVASNGIFKSPTHKAVVNPKFDRFSLAMLFIPSLVKEIGPLNALITEDKPQLYKRFKDYGQVYTQSIPSGKRPIDLVKITY